MKKIIALLMVVAMLFCFAGCTKAPDPSEDSKKEVIVVGYTLVKPLNYIDEQGNLVGFDTELAQKVFGDLGYDVVFKKIEWSAKYTELNANSIDCIWNGFTANCADDDGVMRSDKVDFSYNYMENYQVVVAKTDSGIASAEDLKGKIGVAEGGSAGEGYAKSFEGVASVKSVLVQTDALLEVASGSASFAVVDVQLAKSTVGNGDYANMKIVDSLSSDTEYYAIGFRKGSDLTALVNGKLDQLAKDGYIAELAAKYNVAETTFTDFSNQK